MNLINENNEYVKWVSEIKGLIQKSRIKASISVNKELLRLYWSIGKSISEKANIKNWGASVVEQLSNDLKTIFPNQQGFSRSNLFSMKKWYEFYASGNIQVEKIQQLVGQIPWGQNVLIITKSKIIAEYALRGTTQPIGVAEYQIVKSIPENLKMELPTIEEIEKELTTIKNRVHLADSANNKDDSNKYI